MSAVLSPSASTGPRAAGARWPLPVAALLMLAANLAWKFPGTLNNDSSNQLAEALSGHYTDWHPPVMAWLWSLMAPARTGPASLLVVHLLLHWLGFLLMADGLRASGRRAAAWIVLLCGAFPIFLIYDGVVAKDIGMASALLTGFGLGFRYRICQRAIPAPVAVLVVVLLAYGVLVRTNAVFAFGPLTLYLFGGRLRSSTLKVGVACSLVLAVLAIPASNVVNKTLLGAQPSGSIYSLMLFDLNGIANNTTEDDVLPPPLDLPREQLKACYTPYWWDTWGPWGVCRSVWSSLGAVDSAERRALPKLWLSEVAAHPVAYLEHRLKVFNSLTYFLVPARHCRFAPGCGPAAEKGRPITPKEIVADYLRVNPLVWPITWLAIGAGLLILLPAGSADEALLAARALLVSGVLYLITLVVIGVATDVRYAYWSVMATLLALVFSWDAHARGIWHVRQERRWVFYAGVLLILSATLSRIFDFTAFVS